VGITSACRLWRRKRSTNPDPFLSRIWRLTGTVKPCLPCWRKQSQRLKIHEDQPPPHSTRPWDTNGTQWFKSITIIYGGFFVQFKVHEKTCGLCSCPEQSLCALWCSTGAFLGAFISEGCGDRTERLCMAQSTKTGCAYHCNRLLFMKEHSVAGSGKQGQPKSTLDVLISSWDKEIQKNPNLPFFDRYWSGIWVVSPCH